MLGDSFREFSNDKILKSTFPEVKPNNFIDNDKKFSSIGISSNIGQSKVIGNILSKLIKNKRFDEDKVLILLPDENLLLPVLNSIPTQINNINVTMGLSLQETSISSLIKLLYRIDKRKYKRDFKYCHYFKDVIELLTHPYIYQFDESITTWHTKKYFCAFVKVSVTVWQGQLGREYVKTLVITHLILSWFSEEWDLEKHI